MHSIGDKNKYMSLLFMKMSQEYFSLGRQGIQDVSADHVKALTKYAHNLTHIVSIGTDARYDQVTLIEADTLEQIYNATVDFRTGAKAKYISVVDTVVGIKAPPRTQR
jgi:hypothetical protein